MCRRASVSVFAASLLSVALLASGYFAIDFYGLVFDVLPSSIAVVAVVFIGIEPKKATIRTQGASFPSVPASRLTVHDHSSTKKERQRQQRHARGRPLSEHAVDPLDRTAQ